jgi:hypothetical protein
VAGGAGWQGLLVPLKFENFHLFCSFCSLWKDFSLISYLFFIMEDIQNVSHQIVEALEGANINFLALDFDVRR